MNNAQKASKQQISARSSENLSLTEDEVNPSPSIQHVNPDLNYVLKVLRRQVDMSAIAFLLVLAIALPFALLTPNNFNSKISAIVDARETVSSPTTANATTEAITSDFLQRFSGTSFYAELYAFLKSTGFDFESGDKTIFAHHVNDLLLLLKIRKPPLSEEEKKGESETSETSAPAVDSAIIDSLSKRIMVNADRFTGIMNLEAIANTPEAAQGLASSAMNFYITTQLTADRDRLKLRSDFLGLELKKAEDYLEELREARQKAETELSGGTSFSDANGTVVETADPRAVQLKTKEAQLQDEVSRLERDYDFINQERLQTRLRLESEYKSLQAKYQPDHPELVAKRAEMLTFAASPSRADELQDQVRALRKRLWNVKAEILSLPQVSQRNQLSSAEIQQQKLVSSLSDLINETDLEYGQILRQLNEPELRTRIKIASPASFLPNPSKNNRRTSIIGALALSAAAAALVLLAREVNNPLARDAWRVYWRTKRPILTQISATSLKKFSRITPNRADELRASLGLTDKHSLTKSRTLLAYRRIELTLRRSCKGKTILFISAGPQDKLSGFFYSLLNIVSTDMLGRCVLVDCNHLDPVFPIQDEKQGLADFLQGSVDSVPIVVLRPPSSSFDLIPPVSDLNGERTRVFQSSLLKKFFDRLAERYDYIFIRSLPETHFIENAALVESATDCIVCIDSDRTTYPQLDRTLVHLESDKVRGLVILGT